MYLSVCLIIWTWPRNSTLLYTMGDQCFYNRYYNNFRWDATKGTCSIATLFLLQLQYVLKSIPFCSSRWLVLPHRPPHDALPFPLFSPDICVVPLSLSTVWTCGTRNSLLEMPIADIDYLSMYVFVVITVIGRSRLDVNGVCMYGCQSYCLRYGHLTSRKPGIFPVFCPRSHLPAEWVFGLVSYTFGCPASRFQILEWWETRHYT